MKNFLTRSINFDGSGNNPKKNSKIKSRFNALISIVSALIIQWVIVFFLTSLSDTCNDSSKSCNGIDEFNFIFAEHSNCWFDNLNY